MDETQHYDSSADFTDHRHPYDGSYGTGCVFLLSISLQAANASQHSYGSSRYFFVFFFGADSR